MTPANRLDAGEPAAGDHERQQPRRRRRALGVGLFEGRDHPVAQVDRVAERLHRQRVRLEAGQSVEVRDRAERDDEVVVRAARGGARSKPCDTDTRRAFEIDGVDVADEHGRALQQRRGSGSRCG